MSEELKFYLVTDTHHYAYKSLGYSDHEDQKCLNESGAIIDAAFEKFIAQDEINIILIAGDLTNNGERASHSEFIEKLGKLKAAEKNVYLITATHDYGLLELKAKNNDHAVGLAEEDESKACRSELREMYYEFGFKEALSEYTDPLSYVAQLAPGFRLLCLNDDGNGRSYCGYDESHLAWILEQIKTAQNAGEFIFAMSHHPVLPPSPIYPIMSKRDMLGDYELMSTIFADAGLQFIFTGHSHMQNIGYKTTEKGNTLWDINTGSLCGFPTPMRRVVLDNEKMTITTESLKTFDWDFKGKDPQQYLRDHFDLLLNDIFDSMAKNLERFADLAGGFSMERKTVYKLKRPIKIAGKVMQKLTVGKSGRILCVSRKVDKSVKDILVKDLLVEIVRNIFSGNEHYSPDTPMYKAIMAVIGRIASIVKHFIKGNEIVENMPAFIASIIYDDTPDNEAVLPITKQ